jgi:hypothetical protein
MLHLLFLQCPRSDFCALLSYDTSGTTAPIKAHDTLHCPMPDIVAHRTEEQEGPEQQIDFSGSPPAGNCNQSCQDSVPLHAFPVKTMVDPPRPGMKGGAAHRPEQFEGLDGVAPGSETLRGNTCSNGHNTQQEHQSLPDSTTAGTSQATNLSRNTLSIRDLVAAGPLEETSAGGLCTAPMQRIPPAQHAQLDKPGNSDTRAHPRISSAGMNMTTEDSSWLEGSQQGATVFVAEGLLITHSRNCAQMKADVHDVAIALQVSGMLVLELHSIHQQGEPARDIHRSID